MAHKRKKTKNKKDLEKLKQTKAANQGLAHEVFLAALNTPAHVFRARKGKGSYNRKKKHKNRVED